MFGKAVKMTELRQALYFVPDALSIENLQLTYINADEPVMREDMVRVGMGTADIRHRAMFPTWAAALTVQFMPHIIDIDSVAALIDAGGTNGVGEWRPERNGAFGTYEVTEATEELA